MFIKTDVCVFSDIQIDPGHGARFIRRDGQPITLFSAKGISLLKRRKKPAKLTLTQAWRRLNKKIKVEEVTRRRTRKTTKINRGIVGALVEEIKKKCRQKPQVRSAPHEAVAKEVKANKAADEASTGSSGALNPEPTASKQTGGGTMGRSGVKR